MPNGWVIQRRGTPIAKCRRTRSCDFLIQFGSTAVTQRESFNERRKYPRTVIKTRLTATIVCDDGREALSAVVHDLSRGGIGLTVSAPLERDAKFTVQIHAGVGPPRLFCRVANCRSE